MKVKFLRAFSKDLDKIQDPKALQSIQQVITEVENAARLSEIRNLKKLKHPVASYRIRTGQYRIGIFIDRDVVEFARVAHRKDIYRIFP